MHLIFSVFFCGSQFGEKRGPCLVGGFEVPDFPFSPAPMGSPPPAISIAESLGWGNPFRKGWKGWKGWNHQNPGLLVGWLVGWLVGLFVCLFVCLL